MFSAGENIGALVGDFGTFSSRVGYAGEDSPRVVIPSAVGIGNDSSDPSSSPRMYIGSEKLNTAPLNTEIRSPIVDGVVTDWDAMEQQWEYAYSILSTESSDHPVVLTEPVSVSRQQREAWTELMFERFHIPGMFVSKSPVLTCFANGRQTGVVVDVGGGSCTVTPVQEGFAISKAVNRAATGGEVVTAELLQLAVEDGYKVVPRGLAAGVASSSSSVGLTPSFYKYRQLELMRDMKEMLCRASDVRLEKSAFAITPGIPFELPDGTSIQLGAARFRAPEVAFTPSELLTSPFAAIPPTLFPPTPPPPRPLPLPLLRLLLGGGVLMGGR